jgi:cation transport protein ChaC
MPRSVPEFWIFGYGSLMWNPGFPFIARSQAVVHGYHRSLCMYSYMYRGTPERPGLVLGLDRGGACHGVAFRVEAENWDATIAYLRAREQVTMMYREIVRPVRLVREGGSAVNALTYVVDRSHAQYAGRLEHDVQLHHVVQGHGQSGSCRDYVLNTVAHLRELGIRDRPLERLATELALVVAD